MPVLVEGYILHILSGLLLLWIEGLKDCNYTYKFASLGTFGSLSNDDDDRDNKNVTNLHI